MIAHSSQFSLDTPIGTRMSLKKPGQEQRIWTVFIGMEKDRYILLRLPSELSDSNVGCRLAVEYVDKSLVLGFGAVILNVSRLPFPLLFLSYPKSVESLDHRNHDRTSCFLQVTLYWESEQIAGHIIDLSRGGCRMAVDAAAGHLEKLDLEGQILSQFSLDGLVNTSAKCVIRNVAQDRQKLFLGISFPELPEEIGLQIEEYVARMNFAPVPQKREYSPHL